MNQTNPTSNKKLFIVSFIIALIAIAVFVVYIRYSANEYRIPVDKEVMARHPDPYKVFDVPLETVKIAYIDLDKFADEVQSGATSSNPEMVGCGDSLSFFSVEAGEGAGMESSDRVNFALQKLFDPSVFAQAQESAKKKVNLYSALSSSNLALKSVQEQNGEVIVKLTGTLKLGGVCDDPRVVAQLNATIGQFFPGKTVVVMINDKALKDYMSAK